jgi:hypothetical protein
MTNPQIENLEKVATILARVPERFVFTGGGTIVLYVDEIIRDELRPTKDVDCVVEIFSRTEYYRLATMLREVGLSECTEPDAPMCRWEYEELLIDIMPCGAEVLGFSNRWYVEGLKNLITYTLPSNQEIYIFSPLYLLASKIEAFLGRGQSFYFSKDIEDIVVLLDLTFPVKCFGQAASLHKGRVILTNHARELEFQWESDDDVRDTPDKQQLLLPNRWLKCQEVFG